MKKQNEKQIELITLVNKEKFSYILLGVPYVLFYAESIHIFKIIPSRQNFEKF
jgi:hypothetical protein